MSLQEEVQNIILSNKNYGINTKDISDGHHTFGELYFHRVILFSIICNQNSDISWKSKQHYDGTMFNESFIVGIDTPEGQYTYHYKLEHWSLFNIKAIERAPEYDGHKPKDIIRLLSILKL